MATEPSNRRARGVIRTCVGCRQRATAGELLRVVARSDSSSQAEAWYVEPDPAGSASGRGAHLHPVAECLSRAERARVFARALRHDVAELGPLSLERLRGHLEHHPGTTTEPRNETGSISS